MFQTTNQYIYILYDINGKEMGYEDGMSTQATR